MKLLPIKTRRTKIFTKLNKLSLEPKLENSPSIEEIISVTLSCTLIRMTEINKIDRSVLYQEFKEWIVNSGENKQSEEILCLRYLKNDRNIY
tara:strand:- start:42 stop:317 length:276 start_codon:yes stop_codon:yes gene_type:complete